MQFLSVKNWEKFQHYKCTNPHWIKLYVSLLDDFLFKKLPDVDKIILVFMWLFAARFDNKIPFDSSWIKDNFGRRKMQRINKLIDLGWLIVIDENGTPNATHECVQAHDQRRSAPRLRLSTLEKKREEKETNCIPPLRGAGELQKPIVSWSTRNIPSDVMEALPQLPPCDNSETFKHSVGHLLRDLGFDLKYEYDVLLDQNGKKGRIDIVAWRENEILAIECDRVTDRRKSIRNLKSFRQPGMILLREPKAVPA